MFNPGSRKQIAERLQGLGVKFDKKTEKGNIIVDEKVLEGINQTRSQGCCTLHDVTKTCGSDRFMVESCQG